MPSTCKLSLSNNKYSLHTFIRSPTGLHQIRIWLVLVVANCGMSVGIIIIRFWLLLKTSGFKTVQNLKICRTSGLDVMSGRALLWAIINILFMFIRSPTGLHQIRIWLVLVVANCGMSVGIIIIRFWLLLKQEKNRSSSYARTAVRLGARTAILVCSSRIAHIS